jgi:Zn-finger nucleic acid-binding protein
MAHEAFRGLVEKAKREALPDGTTPETPHQVAAKFGLPEGAAAPEIDRPASFYRPCPSCKQLMVRRNYAHASGVIIDLCREHGVWFDADELARILAWVRAGGKEPPPPRPQTGPNPQPGAAVTQERPDFFRTLLDALFG